MASRTRSSPYVTRAKPGHNLCSGFSFLFHLFSGYLFCQHDPRRSKVRFAPTSFLLLADASAAKKPPSPRSLTPPFPQKAPLAGVIYATGHGAPEEAASHFQLPGKRGSKPEGIVLIIRQDTSTRFADKTREARSRKCLSGNHNIILTRSGHRERVLPFVKSGNLRRL